MKKALAFLTALVLLLCALGGTALVRSWVDASQRRSVVYAWTPLMLVTLAVTSVFESFVLVGVGWMLLVLCAVRAGQSRGWRERLGSGEEGGKQKKPPHKQQPNSASTAAV